MLSEALQQNVVDYRHKNLLRQRHVIAQRDENRIVIAEQAYINFSSNDYLGLSTSEAVKQALIDGVQYYGVGSGASAQVSGYFSPQCELEQRFAEFSGRDRALYFSSGYLANLGVMATLAQRNSHVMADRICHASILDGIQLSRAKLQRYHHHDITDLNRRLATVNGNALIVAESVSSMEGDIAPLDAIAQSAQQYRASLVIDDAHGIGVLGDNGGGGCEHYHLSQQQVTAVVTPLGKALGNMGALVSGRDEVIEALLQFARSHRYTTALPPALALASLTALQLLQQESWRRQKLQQNIAYFIECAKASGLPLMGEVSTPIQSIYVGDTQRALALQHALRQVGFYLFAVRPPTVAAGSARIRISLNCHHQQQEIVTLVDCLGEHYVKLNSSD